MTITHLVLDIEGTTCPVSFVAEVLFPYARAAIPEFLIEHAQDPDIQRLAQEVELAWLKDTAPEAIALHQGCNGLEGVARTAPYLQLLIDRDVKLTALKDLQGRIWRAGYASGALVAPLFGDVAESLYRWHQEGFTLGVYSSGSVPAQQLLYAHSTDGDLRSLFSHWFDTRIGVKQESTSYSAIAFQMEVEASQVLFISDAISELEAASRAGMAVLFSDREGNPGRDNGRFERIDDYRRLNPAHGPE